MKNAILFGSAGLLILTLVAGCAGRGPGFEPRGGAGRFTGATVTNDLNPDLLRPGNDLFTLGPGDQLEIEILASTPSTTTGTNANRAITAVGPDGKIYFNLLPGLDVWGLTLAQTRLLLEKEMAKYVKNEPQIAVTLRGVGSKYVWLLGRLNKPGIYPMGGPMTLLESIALAGGTSRSASQVTTEDLADLRHSFVVRQGQFLPVDFYRLLREGDVSQNIHLRPDDFVYVPSALAQEVYVLGAVRYPRTVAYADQMTLVSAIANANGPLKYDFLSRLDPGPFTKDAYLSHVAIVRGSLAEPQIAVVDYTDIIKGKALDVRLEPGDIVYVPNSPYTTLKRYLNLIVNTFATTVAANEGVRAAGGEVGVGVSVPVGTR
jgi:protein involved in polysaccharide export with SLBB domain